MAETISAILNLCVMMFNLLILARIVMSFMQVDRYHPVVKLIHDLTEPILAPIRNILPPVGMFDFSPMVALILVYLLAQILNLLVQYLF